MVHYVVYSLIAKVYQRMIWLKWHAISLLFCFIFSESMDRGQKRTIIPGFSGDFSGDFWEILKKYLVDWGKCCNFVAG